MSDHELFLDLSVDLTGFSRIDLLGTGLTERYLEELHEVLPGTMVSDLLSTFERERANSGSETIPRLLEDEVWGPVARNMIMLWYCGRWTALPHSWTAQNGTAGKNTDHVVSPAAYVAGLQWVAAGAHPAGARQQGFGAWATAPEGLI